MSIDEAINILAEESGAIARTAKTSSTIPVFWALCTVVQALTPKVLSFEEVADAEVVWVEENCENAIIHPAVVYAQRRNHEIQFIHLIDVDGEWEYERKDNDIRCWSMRPSNEQVMKEEWR